MDCVIDDNVICDFCINDLFFFKLINVYVLLDCLLLWECWN